jgi:UDP-N-acetylglucosamine transferase subunit ALG13
MKCFVTVGSTKFEPLVACFFKSEIVRVLSDIGIRNIVIQNGCGTIPDCMKKRQLKEGEADEWETEIDGIKVKEWRTFFDFCMTDDTISDCSLSIQKIIT